MSRKAFSYFVLLTFFIFYLSAHGETSQGRTKKALLLIGYVDDAEIHSARDLFEHPHFNGDAKRTMLVIERVLGFCGLKKTGIFTYSNPDADLNIDVLDVNADCPGEDPNGTNLRTVICKEQKARSDLALEVLSQVSTYDELIYIGHSRLGFGLGIGPFQNEFTPDFTFYNSKEIGKLRRVVMASCQSNRYYKHRFESFGVQFVGFDRDSDWFWEDLPMVTHEIASISSCIPSNDW